MKTKLLFIIEKEKKKNWIFFREIEEYLLYVNIKSIKNLINITP